MEVTCPSCRSRFNLPDGVAKPGARLRCSVCKEVFPLPSHEDALDEPDLSVEIGEKKPAPSPAQQRIKKIVLGLVLLGALGGAGWWGYGRYFKQPAPPPPPVEDVAQKVEMLTMRNVRQYFVNNEKIGKIFVIEGKVVNEFPEPRELIQVEATLYRADGAALVSKPQLAGTVLSLFQLQVLGENELESFINNKIEILTNNTNIAKGGEAPFMVLFYDPPPDVAEFTVKIVDVKKVQQPDSGT